MVYQNKQFKFRRQPAQKLLLSIIAVSLLLLSACSTGDRGAKAAQPTVIATPTIDAATRSQGDTQLQAFGQWIALMKDNGGDITSYQQQYDSDKQALDKATTTAAYQASLKTLNSHVAAIRQPAMKAELQHLQHQLNQQAADFGKQHTYYDSFDKVTYPLGFEYSDAGIAGWVQGDMDSAQNIANFQQAIENAQMYLTNFQAMLANSADKTPYNQPHKTDLQLMQHYDKAQKRVVVVSLFEQAVRVYENGQLVKAFLATTGRPSRPTPPGVWWVEGKQSPTVFKSGVPKTSPDYYPDTPINYAMQYHSGGYFIHDSWWRADYGPGTNFPHQDSSGDSFSTQGSHGCVNLSTKDAGWIYNFVQVYTNVIIY